MLLLMFLILFSLAKKDSATTDEGLHIISGYSYWDSGKFYLEPDHPPLFKELATLPLKLLKLNQPSWNDHWSRVQDYYTDSSTDLRQLADEFLYQRGNDAQKILLFTRVPIICLTLLLGIFIYLWSKQISGIIAAIIVLFVYILEPNILAHGHIVKNDMPLAVFFFITIYYFRLYLKSDRNLWLILSGIFLGCAIATKFTGAILSLVLIILYIRKIHYEKSQHNVKILIKKYLLDYLLIIIIAIIVVWGSYGFKFEKTPKINDILIQEQNQTTALKNGATKLFYLKIAPEILPATIYKGLLMVQVLQQGGRPSYLMGHYSQNGWWYYYPIIFLIKVPISIIIGIFWLIILKIRKIISWSFEDEIILIPPLVFLIFAMMAKYDPGIRHILVILPFIILWLSQLIQYIIKIKKGYNYKVIFAIALIIFYIYSVVKIYPNQFAYFNEFIGGPKNGYKYAIDSNLDWGQDLIRVKTYLQKNNINNYNLAYEWGEAQARYYLGKDFKCLNVKDGVQTGFVVIGKTALQSPPDDQGNSYDWLKQYQPIADIDHTFFVYQIPKK